MSKHTPGPWIIKELPNGDLFVEAPKSKTMPYALDVCGDDYTGYGDIEQRNINMYLIAAAPDLLEAAKDIMADAKKNRFKTPGNLFHNLAKAIAKAEGKEGA